MVNNFTVVLNYVVCWQSRNYLAGVLQYLERNMALFVQ